MCCVCTGKEREKEKSNIEKKKEIEEKVFITFLRVKKKAQEGIFTKTDDVAS